MAKFDVVRIPEVVRASGFKGNAARLLALAALAVAGLGFYWWFVARVEVLPNQIMVLINKTGQDIPPEFGDQIVLYPELVKAIAAKAKISEDEVRNTYKGVRYEVFPEGRYFIHPYYQKHLIFPATIVDQGEVGVKIRAYGRPLAAGKTVATESDERGPVADILTRGRHNINLLAYQVQKFPAVQIPEGHAGVVTLLSGPPPKVKNTYTVEPGEKGVQRQTRPPGLEYINPYLEKIHIVDTRSKTHHMVDDHSIHFPSNDSFTITIEGTIEWAIRPENVAMVTVAYGEEDDIVRKIIRPSASSVSRIQGSKLRAREFISGKTRTAFQTGFADALRDECWVQGIDIKSALVRGIITPSEIAIPVSQREQADQLVQKFTNQIQEAASRAKLVEQEAMQLQNQDIGDANRKVVTMVKAAEERNSVDVTGANRELEVVRLELEAARKQAEAILSRGQAEAKVVLLDYQAKAEPLSSAVAAFGDGQTYAQHFFLKKVAPAIESILSNTEGPFAEILKQFQSPSPAKGVTNPPREGAPPTAALGASESNGGVQ